ncbi:MAG: T9SS type A sorting domain-containing protein [Candidatus Eisenbacteria bacterium]|uniref:T9SS type A sorting domain-containing protein n=1 Tax=Eiseniibacteriota bacterium TaxID=2212470 RepID=A0A956NEA9_UNCEI|nr:T9SS type A sorting domain-containing protein [Candidatus Eisenbacteria bacterium]
MKSVGSWLLVLLVALASLAGSTSAWADDLFIDINGTPTDATITASVVGSASFQSDEFGVLAFFVPPQNSGVLVSVEGPNGPEDPWILRGTTLATELDYLRISMGDLSTFTLDENNPITSSSNFVDGDVTDLAAYDGVTTLMPVYLGSGSSVNVTIRYNIEPELPPQIFLDVNGTPDNATLTASVVGPGSFLPALDGTVEFYLEPDDFGVLVSVEGVNGPERPWIVRGPGDGSYLNLLRISMGDFSTFTLDETHPITSSSAFVAGDVTDLAVFDGVTTLMSVLTGYSESTEVTVTIRYNIRSEIFIDVNGSETVASLTATVVGPASFVSNAGVLDFLLGPDDSGVLVSVEGLNGPNDPWIVRGPADASYLNLLRISMGDLSTFTLDENNPITSSLNFVSGSPTDLAVFDGVTTVMSVAQGSGPDVSVTIRFNIELPSHVFLDVNGTPSNATLTASVVGDASLESNGAGVLDFLVLPDASDVYVSVEGPNGPINPWVVRGPADGSYLNLLRISNGSLTPFTLDAASAITSSSNFVSGDVTDLAVFDGVTTLMPVSTGSGPDVYVTLRYNIVTPPEVFIDVNGTPDSATLTASVVGGVSFQPNALGALDFRLDPDDFGVVVAVDGANGTHLPWIVHGPVDGSYLSLLRIAMGDFSTFTLDENNPITSSSNFVSGNVTDLAVFDGVTTMMSVAEGSGPDVNVTFRYNIVTPSEVFIDVNGTPNNATLTASVVGDASFQAASGTGVLDFLVLPDFNDVQVVVEGANGPNNPWIVRGPVDGLYLNYLRISMGDLSTFTLDENHPITSSSTFVSGDVTDLAVFDGVTTLMPVSAGSGPDVNVTIRYHIVTPPEIFIDVDGTPDNATLTASVVGDASFRAGGAGVLDFFVQPNAYDIYVAVEGANGPGNPWFVRGPADGSYVNFLRISMGDFSTFTLDENNPITSSSNIVSGNVTDLAVFDGVTTLMPVYEGSGPDANVTIRYNIVTPPPQVFIDVDGTPDSATLTASVVGNASFESDLSGVLDFFLPPNTFDVRVEVEGLGGALNPWTVRGPADGSYLNFLRISTGDNSPFTLDENNPMSSSSNFVTGDPTDLAVFDGVTTMMAVATGSGPDVNVTIRYNIDETSDAPDFEASAIAFQLAGAFPNPFSPQTTIRFTLPEESAVDLAIYNVSGRLVRTLIANEPQTAGRHEVVWDGRDASGRELPSGVYLSRLESGGQVLRGRMNLMK